MHKTLLSLEELKREADPAIVKKGEALYLSRAVSSISQTDDTVTATVSGTEHYQVSLQRRDGNWDFHCTCPAISYQGVCKHCVAVVMACHNTESEVDTAKTPAAKEDPDARLKAYIQGLSPEVLADELFKLVSHDQSHYKRWLNKSELAAGQADLKSLKKVITKVLPARHLWEYRKVSAYFTSAENTLSDVLDRAQVLSADDQFKLVFHGYQRLNKALEKVDDSAGYRFGVESMLNATLCKVVAQLNWTAKKKAQWLYDALVRGYDVFPAIPRDFNLDEADMKAFTDVCQMQFDAIEVEADVTQREPNYHLNTLGRILLSHAPEAQTFALAIAIKAKMITSMRDTLSIVKFCLEQGEMDAAQDWLRQAKAGSDDGTQLWLGSAVEVHLALGKTDQAWQYAWQQFQGNPSFDGWITLRRVCEAIERPFANIYADVEQALVDAPTIKRRGFYHDASDLLRFYLSNHQNDKALLWLSNNKADESGLRQATKHFLPDPDTAVQAIDFAARALAFILSNADKRAYQEGVDFLASIEGQLPDNELAQTAFAALITSVAKDNARRPNMMILLRNQFSRYLS